MTLKKTFGNLELRPLLGTEHTFFESQNNTSLIDATSRTSTNTIDNRKAELEAEIVAKTRELNDAQYRVDNNKSTGDQIQDDPYTIQDTPADIKNLKDRLQRIDVFSTITNFKVTQAKTKNFMDYDTTRTYFNKNQATIMKDEVKKYY